MSSDLHSLAQVRSIERLAGKEWVRTGLLRAKLALCPPYPPQWPTWHLCLENGTIRRTNAEELIRTLWDLRRRKWAGWTPTHSCTLNDWLHTKCDIPGCQPIQQVSKSPLSPFPVMISVLAIAETTFIFGEPLFELIHIRRIITRYGEADWYGLTAAQPIATP